MKSAMSLTIRTLTRLFFMLIPAVLLGACQGTGNGSARPHLGAGTILSNVRLDHQPVTVKTAEGIIPTGLRKFGAIVGDRAEIGCNAVLSPGSIIGRDTIIYPNTSWRGVLPANSIGRVEPQTLKIIPRQTRD